MDPVLAAAGLGVVWCGLFGGESGRIVAPTTCGSLHCLICISRQHRTSTCGQQTERGIPTARSVVARSLTMAQIPVQTLHRDPQLLYVGQLMPSNRKPTPANRNVPLQLLDPDPHHRCHDSHRSPAPLRIRPHGYAAQEARRPHATRTASPRPRHHPARQLPLAVAQVV